MMCLKPVEVWPNQKRIMVPCNRCVPCLINKRNEWTFRLFQEYRYSRSALFVTLTYNEKHYPSDGSLCKRHVQLYLKRLRKKDGTNKIRYYAVGEYGSRSMRAHYHLLLFNCSEQHARSAWCDQNGKPVGIVHCGGVSLASIAYVTKYIIQPQLSIPKLQKPFALMSRGYGIGARYLTDEMVAWHREDDRNYAIQDGHKVSLPRFYKDKIWPIRYVKFVQDDFAWQLPESELFYTDRERVKLKSKWFSIEKQRTERRFYIKKYGKKEGIKKLTESRNAVLQRVKLKVAFSQTL